MESDTEEALRRRGAELVGLVLIGVAALAAVDDLDLLARRPEPLQRHRRGAAATRSASSAPRSPTRCTARSAGPPTASPPPSRSGACASSCTSAKAARVGRAIAVPVALLVAATFAATHVPPAAWTDDYGLGGLLGDAVLGALLGLSPLDLTLSLRIATVALALAFVASAGYALGVTWAEARGFLRFLGQGSVVLYAGAHGLTGRAVAGAADGARAARDLAAEARARRAAQLEPTLPRPAASGAIPRFDPAALRSSEDSVMAKITDAVRARAEAEAGRAGSRAVPPLTAADTDLAVLERDVPPGPDGPPEPRVQPPKPRPLPKSARARSEEEPELALDPDAPEAWRTPPLSLLQSPSTIVRHHLSNDALEENARMLENVLDDYGVRGEIVSIRPGPVVTMYELEPAAGLKASPRHRPRRRHRPLDVGPRLPLLDHPRPLGHRHRAAERAAREGPAARDPRRQGLRRQRPRAAPRARQGHRRRAGGGEPRPHAAPADRRHHRLGQVGRDQHHDPVASSTSSRPPSAG